MRRLAVVLLLAAVLAALIAPPSLAQQVLAEITSPQVGQEVRGVVAVMGSASVPNFQFYKVEWGVGPNPTQWAVIGELYDTPVINGQLVVWDTTTVPDGVYSLRLHAVMQDGNWHEFHVRNLVVANARPAPTPTEEPKEDEAEETPTPRPEEEAAPTPPMGVTPRPTATVAIIQPAAPLAAATPTATIVRPTGRESLQLEPGLWSQAFCYGAASMGAVFVLLGVVLGLRRLL